jgi:hypothetical protein
MTWLEPAPSEHGTESSQQLQLMHYVECGKQEGAKTLIRGNRRGKIEVWL